MMQIEIQVCEIKNKMVEGYALIDIRNEVSVQYGMIPGGVTMSEEELLQNAEQFKQYPGVIIYCTRIQSMMPKLHSINFEGMELIRPMYLIREGDIKAWRDANDLYFLQCACKFTDTCSSCQEDGQSNSKRLETKKIIDELKKTNPYIEGNIFKSVENVMLDTVISYKQNGVRHHFLDEYDK